jgi:hypothetical protein
MKNSMTEQQKEIFSRLEHDLARRLKNGAKFERIGAKI